VAQTGHLLSSAEDRPLDVDIRPTGRLAVLLLVTLAALVAVRVMHHIPIAGLSSLLARESGANFDRFSIAAVAVPAWFTAAALMQLLVMIAPEESTRRLCRYGCINPFCLVVLLLTAGIACVQASGVAHSLETNFELFGVHRFKLLAVGSLMAGTAAIIAFAWFIDRFGVGHGFWIVLAAQSIIAMGNWVSQRSQLMETGALEPTTAVAGLAALIMLTALTVLITLKAHNGPCKLDLVAWPLLLANMTSILVMLPFFALFQADPDTKGMPENIPAYLAGSLVALAIILFVLTRRNAKPHLFVPMLGSLALMEVASYGALHLRPDYHVELPLPTGSFVAMIAVCTVTLRQFWRRSAVFSSNDRSGP
jgi:hypothetical protein